MAITTKTPEHHERLLDQAIAESFPASDPISPAYEASLEPVLLEQNRSREIWKRRLRKARPSLIALGRRSRRCAGRRVCIAGPTLGSE